MALQSHSIICTSRTTSSLTGSNSSTSATTDDCDARLHSQYIHWYKYIALFDSQTWNVYGMSDIMINICESEGFHYALNQAVLIRHPSVYRLIQVLQDIEAASQWTMAQLALGAPPKNENKSKFRLMKPCSVWTTTHSDAAFPTSYSSWQEPYDVGNASSKCVASWHSLMRQHFNYGMLSIE